MGSRVDVFDDFHVHGASAPEWNQRYLQVSRGVMRSRLTEFVGEHVHVFRKWMSERVVQEGGLPGSQVCFALPLRAGDGEPVAQSRSLPMDSLLELTGGADFTLQRPPNMELLAVTLDSETLRGRADAAQLTLPQRTTHSRVVSIAPEAAQDLRARLLAALTGTDPETFSVALINDALVRAIATAPDVTSSVGRATAAYVVQQTHRMVTSEAPDVLSVAAVCARLRVSRRTLQNSFRLLADTTPLDYMRAVRLNAVRARLRSSDRAEVSVGQAAADCGFDHLSHFVERYSDLFGELPSRTPRAGVRQG